MAKDPCETCKSIEYTRWRKTDSGDESCNMCDFIAIPWNPDIYFDSKKGANQTDFNLQDRYKGKIPFSSKRGKAIVMRQLKLRECGDKEHGARNFDKRGSKQWEGM